MNEEYLNIMEGEFKFVLINFLVSDSMSDENKEKFLKSILETIGKKKCN